MQNNIPTVYISEIHCCYMTKSILNLPFRTKILKIRVLMATRDATTRACVQLANYEYFMLNQCLGNIGGMPVFLV
jgi:hypothetical protein